MLDIFSGYNIDGFDFPYLIKRAETLRIDREFSLLGRVHGRRSIIREETTSSKAYGTRIRKTINIPGRLRLDLLPLIRRAHKLSSYKLNAVAFEFLQSRKEEVHYSIISTLHKGSRADRARLASYCLKDAILPVRLLKKLALLENTVALSRVAGKYQYRCWEWSVGGVGRGCSSVG